MGNESVRVQSLTGFVWKMFEKAGSQLMMLVVQIVLARLLLPEDYGIIGYLTLFTTLSDVFLKQGFTTALIQKSKVDDVDLSTVFFANIGLSVGIYFIFYISAPLIAEFYHEPRLTDIMRVLSLNVIIGATSSVHEAIMVRNLEFKKSFLRGLVYTLVYGISGIIMAFLGYGVWSLVYSRLMGLAAGAFVYWITVKWVPSFQFSFFKLKRLFSFSSKVLATNILNTIYNNINTLLIGRLYSSSDVGFYQRGQSIPQAIMTSIDGSMSEVMYPTFSKLQEDLEQLKAALRRSMRLSMYIVMPLLAGLFVVSEPLTIALLTDKWLPSVPYMKLTCVLCMFWPLSQRIHAVNAIGKSSATLKLSLLGKGISLVFVFALVRLGVVYIMFGLIVSSFINFIISSIVVKKYVNYSLGELLTDIGPAVGLSLLMSVIVYPISFLKMGAIKQVAIQILVGAITYIGGSILFRIDSYLYIVRVIRNLVSSKSYSE